MTPAAEKTGRHKRSEAQQQHTEQMGAAFHDAIKEAKETLRNNSAGTKPAYNNPYLIAYKLALYIEQCRQQDKPLTETGLRVALGIERDTFKRYMSGENDYIYRAGMEARQPEQDIQIELDKYKQIDNIQETANYLLGATITGTIDKEALGLSTPIQKARELVSLEREERLAKSGKVADIYTMKAREGEDWQEAAVRTEHVIDIKQVNAISALELLGYSKE